MKPSKLKLNKKAEVPVGESVMLFIHIIPVIVLSIFLSILLFSYLNIEFRTQDLETNLLSKTLRYNCLVQQSDPKTHPGIIDLTKVEDETLRECFSKDSLSYTVKILQNNQEIKKATTMNARDLANFKVCSTIKNLWCKTKTEPVLVNNKPALMKIEVIGNA